MARRPAYSNRNSDHIHIWAVEIALTSSLSGAVSGATTVARCLWRKVLNDSHPDSQKRAVERVAGVLFSDVLNSDSDVVPSGRLN